MRGALATLGVLVVTSLCLPAQQPGTLRAGASKVDVTPAPDAALPMSGYANRTEGFKKIHDDLNVRAVVVDDGRVAGIVSTSDIARALEMERLRGSPIGEVGTGDGTGRRPRVDDSHCTPDRRRGRRGEKAGGG